MPAGLSVVSPDGLVVELMNDDIDTVVEVVEAQAAALTNPPMTTRQLLDGLDEVGLVRTVAQLRSAVS